MYEKALTESGLSPAQAVVYEVLLRYGAQSARSVHARSPFKRGLIYKALEQLIEQGLVEKIDFPKKVAIFRANHPFKIKELAEARHKIAENSLSAIEQTIGQLSSDFNLATGQPGVRFFEGEEGLKKVWWDTLNSKTAIYTYGDLEATIKRYGDLNKQYVNERRKRQIKKLAIANDTSFNRQVVENFDKELTETRFVSLSDLKLDTTIVQIYDGRVSYTTLGEDSVIGVIITDKNIYELNKRIFEKLWREVGTKDKTFKPPAPLSVED